MDHVLIVDDEPKVAFFLGKALERLEHNCRVSVAQSGEEALEVLNEEPVDLLVTDLQMPGINGLELARQVQVLSPDTRIILITAYGNDAVQNAARRLKIDRYITKPFNIRDFMYAVQGALGAPVADQPGLTVLSGKLFDAIVQQLDGLRQEVGAGCVFLADMQGQCLAKAGDVAAGLEPSTLLALLAGGFATSSELARRFGDGQAVNLNYHQGSRYGIYSANVGENLFTALVYDQEARKSRIGIVWLYTQRMIEQLLSILSSAQDESSVVAVDADFSSAVMTELDALFLGEKGKTDPGSDRPGEAGGGHASSSHPAGRAAGESQKSPSPGRSHGEEGEITGGEPVRTDESDSTLFSLNEAIERGLLPSEFGDGTT